MNYKEGAYDSTRYSLNSNGTKASPSSASEENKALGGATEVHVINSTSNFKFVQMKVPEWFCSTICSGLNIDDLVSGDGNIESPDDNSIQTTNFTMKAEGTEENQHINNGRLSTYDDMQNFNLTSINNASKYYNSNSGENLTSNLYKKYNGL